MGFRLAYFAHQLILRFTDWLQAPMPESEPPMFGWIWGAQ